MFRDLQWLKERRSQNAEVEPEANKHSSHDRHRSVEIATTAEIATSSNDLGCRSARQNSMETDAGACAKHHADLCRAPVMGSEGSPFARGRAEAHGDSMVDVCLIEQVDPREVCREVAERLWRDLDLSGVERLLDISGLDGALSIVLSRHNPALNSTVFDRPSAVEPLGAEESFVTVERPQAGDRVTFMRSSSHDMWLEVLRSRHDAVLVSHAWGDDEPNWLAWAEMCEFAFEGLRPGGLVVLYDPKASVCSSGAQAMEASGFNIIQTISFAERGFGSVLVGRRSSDT
jgi:hypothetical protein